MIVTVTPNPSLDRTYTVAALRPGELNRATGDTVEASGKGVNVARVLHAAGVRTGILLPAGGPESIQLRALLDAEGLSYRVVQTAAPMRTNITVLAPGQTTKLNAPGHPLAADEADGLVAAVAAQAPRASWVVCSGSLPPGTPADLIGRIVAAARRAGAKTAVDASGAALAAAVEAGPELLAPNADELAELTGQPLPTSGPALIEAALVAARKVVAATGGGLLVSLGADGALWVDAETALHAAAEPVTPVNTAGAGDALLAGWLAAATAAHPLATVTPTAATAAYPPAAAAVAARPSAAAVPAAGAGGHSPGSAQDRLRTAVAWGTAACLIAATAGDVAAAARPESVRIRTVLPDGP